jgi:hypothetical protein
MRAAMCCRTSNMRACEKESGVLPWVSSHTDAWNACWCGKLMGPIFDRRETVMGPCPRPRTVCESVGERWCDGAGCLLTLGFRSQRREMVMERRNSHFETLRRTQTVEHSESPQSTISEAYR